MPEIVHQATYITISWELYTAMHLVIMGLLGAVGLLLIWVIRLKRGLRRKTGFEISSRLHDLIHGYSRG